MMCFSKLLKRSLILIGTVLLFGAVMTPAGQVKAAANWWWDVYYPSQAPGAYVCKTGATSNGAQVRARLKGISTSTRQMVYSKGNLVSAPTASYISVLDVWNPVGYFTYY